MGGFLRGLPPANIMRAPTDCPDDWSMLNLTDLFWAYRKAKADCFAERAMALELAFTKYEQSLYSNLRSLEGRIQRDGIAKVLLAQRADISVVGKSLGSDPLPNSEHAYFSSSERSARYSSTLRKSTAAFRLVGDFDVETHVLSALWINFVGHKLEEKLRPCSYGSRLRRRKSSDSRLHPGTTYDLRGLRSFQGYPRAYQRWRDDGFEKIQEMLETNEEAVVVTFDVSNFYHSIDPNFLSEPNFLLSIGVSLTDKEVEFTRAIASFMSRWSDEATRTVFAWSRNPGSAASVVGGVPIGLSAATLAANLVLHSIDEVVMQNVRPAYYGRYVDDIFLVIQGQDGRRDPDGVLDFLCAKIPMLRRGKTRQDVIQLQLGSWALKSTFTLHPTKQRYFFLEGSSGLDFLRILRTEFSRISSERRLMPDVEDLDHSVAADTLTANPNGVEPTIAFGKADRLSLRRMGWSVHLKHIDMLARDLKAPTWKTQRDKVYQLAKDHVMRVDSVFDYLDNIPRLFGIAAFTNDFDEIPLLWISFTRAHELARACASSVTANGYPLTSGAVDVWEAALENMRRRCLSAVIAALPANCSSAAATAISLLSKGGKGLAVAKQESTQMLQADLGRTSYAEAIRRGDIEVRKCHRNETKIADVFPDTKALEDFLSLSNHSFSAFRRTRKAATTESRLPYLFPTRPLRSHDVLAMADLGNVGARGRKALSEQRLCEYVLAVASVELNSGQVKSLHEATKLRTIGEDDHLDVRVAIASLLTEDSAASMAAKRTPDLSAERYRSIRSVVNQAIRANPRPDYLVLPELSLPHEWFETVSNLLIEERISLIASLEHTVSDDGQVCSEVAIVLRNNRKGWSETSHLRQFKEHPAVHERTELAAAGLSWRKIPPGMSTALVYRHHGFHFGILICSEFLELKRRAEFLGKIDCLIVLAWNRDLTTFSSTVESTATDLHAYVVVANNRRYGDSRVQVAAEKIYRREVCRIKGGTQDYVVVVGLDVKNLRRFQLNKKVEDELSFKPLPQSYVVSPTRRKDPDDFF